MVSCKTSLFKNAPTNLHEIFSINVHSYEEQVEFLVAKKKQYETSYHTEKHMH